MSNPCVKTGCTVQLDAYGYHIYGDLFKIGNALIIRYTQPPFDIERGEPREPILIVRDVPQEIWHRPDIGVTIFPESICTAESFEAVAKAGGYRG